MNRKCYFTKMFYAQKYILPCIFYSVVALLCCMGCASVVGHKSTHSSPIEHGYFSNYYELRRLPREILLYTSYRQLVEKRVKALEYCTYTPTTYAGERYRHLSNWNRVEFDSQYTPIVFLSGAAGLGERNERKGAWSYGWQYYYRDIVDEWGRVAERAWYKAKDSSYSHKIVYNYTDNGQISRMEYGDFPREVSLHYVYNDSLRLIEMVLQRGNLRYRYNLNDKGDITTEYISRLYLFGLWRGKEWVRESREYEDGKLQKVSKFFMATQDSGTFLGKTQQYSYEQTQITEMAEAFYEREEEEPRTFISIVEYNTNGLPAKIRRYGEHRDSLIDEIVYTYEYHE